jgi:hypothetical protein
MAPSASTSSVALTPWHVMLTASVRSRGSWSSPGALMMAACVQTAVVLDLTCAWLLHAALRRFQSYKQFSAERTLLLRSLHTSHLDAE